MVTLSKIDDIPPKAVDPSFTIINLLQQILEELVAIREALNPK